MIYQHNGILCLHKEEWEKPVCTKFCVCTNMECSPEYTVKWKKKRGTEQYIQYVTFGVWKENIHINIHLIFERKKYWNDWSESYKNVYI